jgi:hypothetical protein
LNLDAVCEVYIKTFMAVWDGPGHPDEMGIRDILES